jgi:hypothetical protein
VFAPRCALRPLSFHHSPNASYPLQRRERSDAGRAWQPNPGNILNGLPFFALVVVWIAGYFIVRLRRQRELDRELDELNAIENENTR